jgi:hypothetical protein
MHQNECDVREIFGLNDRNGLLENMLQGAIFRCLALMHS